MVIIVLLFKSNWNGLIVWFHFKFYEYLSAIERNHQLIHFDASSRGWIFLKFFKMTMRFEIEHTNKFLKLNLNYGKLLIVKHFPFIQNIFKFISEFHTSSHFNKIYAKFNSITHACKHIYENIACWSALLILACYSLEIVGIFKAQHTRYYYKSPATKTSFPCVGRTRIQKFFFLETEQWEKEKIELKIAWEHEHGDIAWWRRFSRPPIPVSTLCLSC